MQYGDWSVVSLYKILAKLGEGGMGVVYKAEDTKLERTVALKFLSLTSIGEEQKKRFKREAKPAASLSHPNIATIHATDEADDHLHRDGIHRRQISVKVGWAWCTMYNNRFHSDGGARAIWVGLVHFRSFSFSECFVR